MSAFMDQISDELDSRKAVGLTRENDAVTAVLEMVKLSNPRGGIFRAASMAADASFTVEVAGEQKQLQIGWTSNFGDDDSADDDDDFGDLISDDEEYDA